MSIDNNLGKGVDLKLRDDWKGFQWVNGDIPLTINSDAVTQGLKQALLVVAGEWAQDLRIGIPYAEYVWILQQDKNVVDSIFKTAILNQPGVLKLLEFNIDDVTDDNNQKITAKIKTVDKTEEISLTISPEGFI